MSVQGKINKYTLEEVAVALSLTVDEISNLQIENTNQHKKTNNLPPSLNIIEQLKAENDFLKNTINQQWELINELSKKVGNKK